MGYFTFNGKSSLDFGLRVTNDYKIVSTGNDVDTVTVDGRDGDLLISNNRLKSVSIELPCTIKSNKSLQALSTDISNWLNVEGYKDMTLSWDSDYIYRVAFIETFEIASIMRQFGTIKLNFLAQPVKFFKDSMQRQNLSNGLSLNGKGNVKAKPIIKLTGNGETVLTINGRKTKLKDIQGNIVLDMQSNQVYSGNLSAWNKVVRSPEFVMPFLDPGRNLISWTGNFTAEITPFWGVKL